VLPIEGQDHRGSGAVQNLLMDGAFPVHAATAKIYFASDVPQKKARPTCAPVFVARFACERHRNA
jgi:hypothetical protein